MTQTTTEKRGKKLDDYSAAIGAGEIAELRALASRLQGKSVHMVNSTSVGGGMAEMLIRLVPLIEEMGLRIRWDVITGGDDFFAHHQGISQRAARRAL